MRLRVSPRARKRALLVNKWWKSERPAAPSLFLEELHANFEMLLSSPKAWPVFGQDKQGRNVRRGLLPRTQQHVYYRIDEQRSIVHIITVWGVKRGCLPAL